MPGGNKNILPEDGIQFAEGNKAAEKWTETEALKLGNDLLEWMKSEDENIFFDDFLFISCDEKKYAGRIYKDLPVYLAKKFSSFLDILEICKKIEETKLKKFSAFDKLNASIAKFVLSAKYDYKEKTDTTSNGQTINIPISKWADDGTNTDTEL